MGPKGLSPEAKQAMILEWFRNSMSAYPLSELEKAIPSATGIAKQLVKEFLQVLTDEGLLRVEKIGISNWYWSFVSDAKQSKETMLKGFLAEEAKLAAVLVDTSNQIESETALRQDDEQDAEAGVGMKRAELLALHGSLQKENESLAKALSGYSDSDPTEMLRRVEETKKCRESAERWTDNIDMIESYLRKKTGDKVQVAQIMQQCCGDEYVPGEGLKEL